MARSTWNIDPDHTVVEFAVKHMMFSTVKGRFGGVSGTIELDEDDITRSSVSVEIDAATVDTQAEQRDQHLRSADFFDVENHPKITFRSKRVERTGDDTFRVIGDLTIRGVTKEVVLETTDLGRGKDPWGGERAGFEATTSVNREEFGLTWNAALEAGGVLVGPTVKITLAVQAVKSAEEAAA